MKLTRQNIIGIVLVFIGSSFLLKNLDLVQGLPSFIFSWVNIFFVLAVINALARKWKQVIVFGLLWCFFFLDHQVGLELGKFWPLILVAIGASFIVKDRLCEG